MKRTTHALLAIAIVAATVSCHSIRQQKAIAPIADSAQFHNLQVLPSNMTREQLLEVMRGFTNGLGVHCDHCHVRIEGTEDDFDFPSDGKPAKDIARAMIMMTRRINDETVLRVNPDARPVTCVTCHRGKKIPEPSSQASAAATSGL